MLNKISKTQGNIFDFMCSFLPNMVKYFIKILIKYMYILSNYQISRLLASKSLIIQVKPLV